MDNRKITLAVTTYNRYDFLLKCFADVVDDERINEIVIVDDHSDLDIFDKIVRTYADEPKVYIYRNAKNLGVYKNKYQSVKHSCNDWVIVFDSDNVIKKDYIDKLYERKVWLDTIVYCPDFAKPQFDYRNFGGVEIFKNNAAKFFASKQFDCLINTMNCFVNREKFLDVYDPDTEPFAADSAYFNYRWLMKGNSMLIIPGLEYEHTVHPGSHYVQTSAVSNSFHTKMMNAFKNMK